MTSEILFSRWMFAGARFAECSTAELCWESCVKCSKSLQKWLKYCGKATNSNQLIQQLINVPPPSDSPPSSIHRCRSARRPSESRSIVLVGYDIPSPALKADNNHITCLYHVYHTVNWYIARGMLFIYVIFWYRFILWLHLKWNVGSYIPSFKSLAIYIYTCTTN